MKKLFKYSVMFCLCLLTPIIAACGGNKGKPEHQHNYKNNVCIECLDGAVVYVENGTSKSYFATLQEAVDYTPSSTTQEEAPESFSKIVLMQDCSGNGVKITNFRKIEFDFAGFTYTLNGQMVGSVGTETNGFQILKDTQAVFKNGTLKQGVVGAKAFIQNYTDITLDNFNLDATNEQSTINCQTVLSCNHGNSIITGNSNIIAPAGQTSVALNYGNLSAYRAKGVQLTFDENYTGTVNGKIEYNNCTTLPDWTQKTILTIKAGVFNIDSIVDDTTVDENIQILGGQFNQDVGKFCADFYECYQDQQEYKVREINQQEVVCYVQTGASRKFYASLQEAIIPKDSTVVLLKDCVGPNFTVFEATYDFNGFTYTIDNGDSSFYLEIGCKAVFKNGKIVNVEIFNYGKVVFDNFDFEDSYIWIDSGEMRFTGDSDLTSTSFLAQHDPEDLGQTPDVYIDISFDQNYVGTVDRPIKCFMSSGWADYTWSNIWLGISNGTFLNFGKLTDCNASISGGTFYNFDFASYEDFYNNSIEMEYSIKITGGTFDCDVKDICYESTTEAGTIQVVENGSLVDKDIWTVKKGTVYINDDDYNRRIHYLTPEDAIAAASDGTTIYCLENFSRKGFGVEGKEIIFDLQGYSYSITTTSVFKTTKNAKLTLKNGTIQPYKQTALKTMIQSYAGVVLDNITLLGTNPTYGGKCTTLIDSYYGTITINNNSRLVASEGNNAIRLYWGANGNYKKGMTVNINSATISGKIVYDADANYIDGNDWVSVTKLNINNGNFDVEFVNVHSVNNANILIYGGIFTTDVGQYCSEGYTCSLVEQNKYQVAKSQ